MDNQLSLLSPKQCPSWEGCEAPLCPLDRSYEKAVWYPDEPVCRARQFHNSPVIRNQRKIAKVARDKETCYTARMLAAIKRVSPGITGINPENIDNEKVWLLRLAIARQLGKARESAATDTDKDLVGVGDTSRHP